ncbi:MAG: hypothetical protein BroJett013_26450 [Alphaproteobacteria bacterium]|nr:MAG: hypothetical protein BroJett013_26450 [Alphaproteobacteria bacterium]
MSKSDTPQKPRWLTILLCIVVAVLVWRVVDLRTTSIWIIAAIALPGTLVIFALVFIFATPSLEVRDGVISARRSFGRTIDVPISQIVSVHKVDHGFPAERLIIRGLRGAEIVIDRRFDEDEINSMLTEVRASRPDLNSLTEGLWSIKPQDGR